MHLFVLGVYIDMDLLAYRVGASCTLGNPAYF